MGVARVLVLFTGGAGMGEAVFRERKGAEIRWGYGGVVGRHGGVKVRASSFYL